MSTAPEKWNEPKRPFSIKHYIYWNGHQDTWILGLTFLFPMSLLVSTLPLWISIFHLSNEAVDQDNLRIPNFFNYYFVFHGPPP
jgi:hypothetical protein